ncbi:MAG: hypothetical protein KGH64_01855 [Candidatus Micrarchaeota archaeon]|nr:hypothetical protein [Candidatus Micrarchaeota archaeon]MDE1834061.1 hypothetical protein [Candidatus Micrarchaeota archaeon]
MVTKVRQQAQFGEVGGNAKSALHIIYHEANHAQSMKILADNGLRPLRHREALSRSSELITELKGKWFYLAGRGTDKSGIYTFNDKGALVESTGNRPIDLIVRVWPGNKPLSLVVYSDVIAQVKHKRFLIDADDWPSSVAPVVVGVERAQAGSVVAAQNGASVEPLPKQVVRDADRQLAKVEKSPFFNEGDLSAVRELVDAAKAQRRQ